METSKKKGQIRCHKTPYTKKEAKDQLYLRNRDSGRDMNSGGVYHCFEHQAYHLSRSKFPVISDRAWKKLKKGIYKA